MARKTPYDRHLFACVPVVEPQRLKPQPAMPSSKRDGHLPRAPWGHRRKVNSLVQGVPHRATSLATRGGRAGAFSLPWCDEHVEGDARRRQYGRRPERQKKSDGVAPGRASNSSRGGRTSVLLIDDPATGSRPPLPPGPLLAGELRRSRRPKPSATRVAAEVEALICQLRRAHLRRVRGRSCTGWGLAG
jgi:hypothetical protein